MIVVFLLLARSAPSLHWLYGVPLLMVAQLIMAYSLGLITGTLNVLFRDLSNLVGILLTMLFYVTPIIYSLDHGPSAERIAPYRGWIMANPATALVAGVGLHFLQNAWAIGWSAAAQDCLGYGQYGGESRLKALRSLPTNLLKNAMQFFYWPWLVLPLMGAGCLIVLHVQKTASDSLRKVAALLLGVLVAPLGWYIFMAAHVHHPHTVSQLWPLFFVTIGLVAAGVFSLLLRPGAQWWMRLVMVMAAFTLIFAQYKSVTTVTQRSGGLPNAMLAEAIGPNAFGHKKGVLFNTAAVAQVAYYLRNSASLCPQHGIRFPEDLPLMRKSLPEDWELKYYVFFAGGNLELFKFLASNCPGEILVVRNFNPPRYVVRFDMRELLKPPDQRKPLDQGIRERQLKMQFPEWKVEGFLERFRQIVRRHSR